MRRIETLFLLFFLLFPCCRKQQRDFYTMGIFQVDDAPTLNEVRKGFLRALEDNGVVDGANIRLIIRNGMGDIPEVQRIAHEFASKKVDMIVALSTPSLQAALHATHEIPIIFSSVANPYLAGAGKSAEDHRRNVTGVSSKGPIRESLFFLKEILPEAKKVGTLWTPSEINSSYYLELARQAAKELGIELVAIPIANKSEVLLSAQALVNKKIDAIYQISDNTINASFEAVGRVAEENSVPLLGGFLLSTHLGACAALGWDFFDMGYKAGLMAIRVKNGESPGDIPFQYMDKIKLYLNLNAAKKQNVTFPEGVLNRADEIIGIGEGPSSDTEIR
ncbi:MAG: ABC transporter substrate-binding protein [Candidatus Aminicenantales bacterium]